MTDPIIGIDLGTTNSAAAVLEVGDDGRGEPRVLADARGCKIQPSVVAFHPSGTVIVGTEAKQRRIIDPDNTVYSSKRLIGRTFGSREVAAALKRMPYTIKEGVNQQPVVVTRAGEFAIPEISAIILDHLRGLAQAALGTDVSRAVITVPANFTDAQRSATATAGAIAGITVVRVINEPTAAALAYGRGRVAREIIAVYDFGGGTFDVTILKLDGDVYEVLATAGDTFLGGDDLDERLVELMAQEFFAKHRRDLTDDVRAMQRLRAHAEEAKIELSRRPTAKVVLDALAHGEGGAALGLDMEIRRDAFLAKIGDLIDATFPVCRNALELAGLAPERLDEVVLVGGTTKMPYVRERVAQFFGRAPRTDLNPDEAVALGAAIQGEALVRVLARAPRRTTPSPAVAPPAPPMQPRSTRPSQPTPAPAEAAIRRIAPPPRHTAARVAQSPDAAPSPSKLIGGAADGATPSRATRPTPAVRPRTTLPRPFTPVVPPPGALGAPSAGHGTPPPIPAAGAPPVVDDFGADTNAATAVRVAAAVAHDDADFDGIATGVAAHPGRPAVLPSGDEDFESAATGLTRRDDVGGATHAPAFERGTEPAVRAAPDDVHALVDEAAVAAARLRTAAPATPTVLEVVPQALGVATVAGYCDEIIHRNSQVPCGNTRVFATSQDFQETVRVRVCLGNSRRFAENAALGEVVLEKLPPRRRSETRIAVTFEVDAGGMIRVSARDETTGSEQRASLNLLGTQTDEQIDAAKQRFRALRG